MAVTISKLMENGRAYFCRWHSQEDLFDSLAGDLLAEGYVKDTFKQALKEREAKYPTGIVCNKYNIALPHVDSEHVQKDALIVAVLDEPIGFHRMDKLEEIIEVQVVFMLLIEGVSNHIQAIANLTSLWLDDGFMDELLKATDKERIVELVKKHEKRTIA